MSVTYDVLRPVGKLEMLYTARQALGVYNSVILTATYLVPSKIDNDSIYSIFCAAIPKLLRQHPSLCCYFKDENTPNPVFKRLNSIEVKEVLQILGLEDQQSVTQKLQELHDQRWSVEQKPLWKMVLMRQPHRASNNNPNSELHVAFVYHHVIGDGLSGAAFHTSLLRELQTTKWTSQDIREVPKTITTGQFTNLIEPVEKLTKLPLSWLFLIKQVVQEYGPRWLLGPPTPLWAGPPIKTLEECPLRSRIRIVTITADELALVLSESKKHNVTLTSLLTATLVSTLAIALPEAPGFLGTTPYTLRRITKTPAEAMVNQTTAFETTYSADTLNRIRNASNDTDHIANLWDTAQTFQTQLRDELSRCPHDNLVGLLPYVTDHVNYYRKKIGRPREATWELSNVGSFTPPSPSTASEPDVDDWKLASMTFTQGAAPIGPAFAVNCVGVADGPLRMSISWQDSIVSEDIVDALARAFEDLPHLLSGGSSA